MLVFFVGLLVLAVIVDLRIGHKGLTVRRALIWSAVWIALSLGFCAVVWRLRGGDVAEQWLTGYLLEKSLSVDNLFVFLIIFRHFGVPPEAQPRVLTWGILGAVVLRIGMIYAGAALLGRYHWVMYLFGASLLYTGVRTLFASGKHRKSGFLVRQVHRLPVTPTLMALIAIELTDIVFAVDSIPAIFAITNDPFIVLTSNVMALIGMRALFFALSGLMERLRYLQYGLGAILVLVGIKICLGEVIELPSWVSLATTVGVLGLTILASLMRPRSSPATSSI